MCGYLLAGLFVAAQTTAIVGKPAIPGTAQVGEELTAVVNGVAAPLSTYMPTREGAVTRADATAPIWAATLTIGRTDSGYSVYTLDDPDFRYQSSAVRVEALAAGSIGVALRTDTGVATLRGLVLEWAGEVLPLNHAPTDRTFFWSRRWLSRNASSLTSPRIALPTGHSGIVCLRTSWQICPATTVTDSAAATGAPAITGTAQVGEASPLTEMTAWTEAPSGVAIAVIAGQTVTASSPVPTGIDPAPVQDPDSKSNDAAEPADRAMTSNRAMIQSGGSGPPNGARMVQPRQGQRQETFVSNLGQSAAIPRNNLINAQTFETGSRSEGYDLTRVALRLNVVPSTTLGVQIYSVMDSGEPDSPLHTLDVPASLADGRIEFTASGSGRVRLEPNTKYAVVIADASLKNGPFASVATTDSKMEDDGKLAGWNISNSRYWRSTIDDDWTRDRSVLLRIEIKGLLPSAATGQPAIAGLAEVGQVLSSGLGTIADVNGLPKGDDAVSTFPDDFNLQWVRVSGATETDIPGATSGTYMLTSADVDSQVKVKVTFTDEDGYEEGPLTSALLPARETIPPRNTTALVSNVGRSFSGRLSSIRAGDKQSQQFTTGSFADGYRISRVDIRVAEFLRGSHDPQVSIYTHDSENNGPGTLLLGLSNPSNVGAGIQEFIGHTRLTANTKYWVIVEVPSGILYLQATSSNAEDNGKAAGWSIANNSYHQPRGQARLFDSRKMGIRIRGTLAPNNAATGQPTLAGTARVGQTLTADISGIADEEGTAKADNGDAGHAYTYQWVRVDGETETNIAGATASTYTLAAADAGKTVKAKVEFTDDADFAEGPLVSAAYPAAGTVALADGNHAATGVPTITGTERVGQVLTADLSGIADEDGTTKADNDDARYAHTYQWVRVDGETGMDIAGATASTYTLAAADAGKTFKVKVEFTDDAGFAEGPLVSAAYPAAGTVALADGNHAATGVPTITGTARAGQVLTADLSGIADEDGTTKADNDDARYAHTYQWVRVDGETETNISGATASTYTLAAADAGKIVKVKVEFTDDAYFAEGPLVSAAYPAAGTVALADGNHAATGVPTITGTARARQVLTADLSGIADEDGTTKADNGEVGFAYTYQWVRVDGETETNIAGATASTYTLAAADAGKTVKVTVSFTDDAGFAEGPTSEAYPATGTIALRNGNHAATGVPTVSGSALVGETLTAETGGIAEEDGKTKADAGDAGYAYTYRWVRVASDDSETNIAGATGSTYTLTFADEGTTVKVKVEYTDDADFAEGPLVSEAYPARGAVTQSNDPSLSELALADGDGSAIPLDPMFARHTVGYTATVAHAVSTVAVTATPTASTATVVYVDGHIRTLTDIDPSTEALDTALEVGANVVRVVVTAPDVKSLRGYTVTVTRVAAGVPTGRPAITGAPQVGEVLTAGKGTIQDPDGTSKADAGDAGYAFTYQWVRVDGESESDITDATSSTYTLTAADEGKTVKVEASFTDDADNDEGPLVSKPYPAAGTIAWTDGNHRATGVPTVSGTARVGGVLRVETGGIAEENGKTKADAGNAGYAYTYQWVRVGSDSSETDIPGATSSTYTLTGDDEGLAVKVEVEYTDDADFAEGPLVSAVYPATGTIAGTDGNHRATGEPTVSGTARVGEALRAETGGIAEENGKTKADAGNAGYAYTYQWVRVGSDSSETDIPGATSSTYTLTGDDEGLAVKVEVEYTDDADFAEGPLVSEAYPATGTIAGTDGNHMATGAPTVSGTARVGEVLTANTGGIADEDGTTKADAGNAGYAYTYQWVRVASDHSETDIPGATAGNYRLTAADEGLTVKVTVSFTDDADFDEGPLTSEAHPTIGSIAARTATIALVSNTDQPVQASHVSIGNTDKAHTQGFTTGSNALGYKLDSVGLRIRSVASGATLTVHIYTADASGAIEALVHTLTSPRTYTVNAVHLFTAPSGATLSPDTHYLVAFVAGGSSRGSVQLHVTSSDAEDAGSAAGWSIENRRRQNNLLVSPSQDSHMIRVHGSAVNHSTNATLSALELEDAEDESAIAIDPAFASASTAYTASVSHSVDEITVVPTTSDGGATVEYLNADNETIADSNAVKEGQQVSLSAGANTIKVKVTAEDGNASETYTVGVTRNSPATGVPTVSGTARVGEALRAETGGIAEENGKTKADAGNAGYAYTYQWVRVGSDSSETDIPGATSSTYTLTGDDKGLAVKVEVEYTDDADFAEGPLVSETFPASGSIAARTATVALVGNTGQPQVAVSMSVGNSDKKHTQGFTTGSNTRGYRLESVGLRVHAVASGASLTVHIYTADASGAIETLVHTLTSPLTYSLNTVHLFTAPAGATLSPDTDYLIAFVGGGSRGSVRLHVTESDAEDVGSAAGWSIENRRRSNNVLVSPAHDAFMISVNGTTVSHSTDATLSALELEDAADESAIAINPAFASATTAYTASVGHGVDEITVVSTTSDGGATVEYLDADNGMIADSDTLKAGHQVSLSAGANTIKVKVTAEDGNATETYTVVVARNTAPTGVPTVSGTAWVSGVLTAGIGTIADANGLPTTFPDDYSFQWVRVAGSSETDITGATASTYTLVAADLGKTVKVKVFFTDDADFDEGPLTSDAYPTTGTVTSEAVLLSVSPATVAENAGDTRVTVTGTLTEASRDTNTAVTVAVGAVTDAATEGTDYATVSELTLTIAAEQSTGTASFTFTPTDDDVYEGDETLTVSGSTTASDLTIGSTAITINENDRLGVNVVPPTLSLVLDEGDSGSFTMALNSQPTAKVPTTVTVPPNTDVSVDKTTLTFTTENWSMAQTVTVRAAEDDDGLGDAVTLTLTGSGGGYDFAGFFEIAVRDNDTRGVTPTPTTLVVPEGGTATYEVVLDTQPSAEVTVTVGGANTDVSVDKTTLTFTTESWAMAQTVTVRAAEDDGDSVDDEVTLSHTAAGGDYAGVRGLDVDVTVRAAATGQPAITGMAQVGQVLTAGVGTIADGNGLPTTFPDDYSFQWVRVDGSSETDITGATSSNYTLTAADEGLTVKVKVEFTDDADFAEGPLVSKAYPATGTIAWTDGNHRATGAPTVTGTAQVGQALTAVMDGIADADGKTKVDNGDAGYAYTYQWVRVDGSSETDITGATGKTYMPTVADEGLTVKVKVSFTDDLDFDEGPLVSAAYPATGTIVAATATPAGTSLVSNMGQPSSFHAGGITSQGFTTGGVGSAYVVTAVQIRIGIAGDSNDILLRIFSTDSRGRPDTELYRFTNPTRVRTQSVNTFTAPSNARLDRNKTYAVVLTGSDGTSDGTRDYAHTFSTNEDSGGAAEWSIADRSFYKEFPSYDWAILRSGNLLRMNITGYALADTTAPVLSTATAAGTSLVLTYDEPLDAESVPGTDAFSVKVAGGAGAAPSGVAVAGSAVTLTLASAVTAGQTVTVSYTVPTGMAPAPIQDPAGNDAAALTDRAVTVASADGNYSATGAPTVSGTAWVGQTLTAETGGIADGNGTTKADNDDVGYVYTYQWVRVASDNSETDITGATASTYTLTADDEGLTVKVSVEFVDDADFDEGPLVSEAYPATGTIASSDGNHAATGVPTVSGTARVGQRLTANTGGIADEDGTTKADNSDVGYAYTYQWVRVASDHSETDITGAMGRTYSLTTGDAGQTVKVKVSFTDDADNAEGPLMSEAYPAGGRVVAAMNALVSNTGQPRSSDYSLGATYKTYAQGFRTGSNVGGYNLDAVGVYLGQASSRVSLTLHVYTAAADNTFDTLAYTLTSPSSYTNAAVNVFTAPAGAILAADTKYQLVFEESGGTNSSDLSIDTTESNAEDPGRAAGWSIENVLRFRGIALGPKFLISVHGSAVVVPASADATLSALELEDADDESAIAIAPAFASATTAYSASVGHGVDEITVVPTTSHDAATVAYLDAANDTLADSDAVKEGQQVSLSVGANTIKVKVTAADGNATETYTVAVTRNSPATGAPTVSGTAQVGEVLTANTGGIADENGTTKADKADAGYAYTYQWIRVDGGSETDITGATASTYMLTAADAGLTLKVKVSFTDDADFDEGPLVSEAYPATGTIAAIDATGQILVSNAAQFSEATRFDARLAQPFDVGPNSLGYTISSVDVHLTSFETTIEVDIYSVDATGAPDTVVYSLTPPANLTVGANTFLAPSNAVLAGNTTYAVAITPTAKTDNGVGVLFTGSDAEDTAAAGWSVGYHYFQLQRWQKIDDISSLITVRGTRNANTAATGMPAISGTALVGGVLEAGKGTIADADGTTNADNGDAGYTYQWVREDSDGSNATDIADATSSTYTLVAADEGKRIKVRASFSDDVGNAEGPLTSDAYPATGTVLVPPQLTASLSPAEQTVAGGQQATLTLRIVVSQEPDDVVAYRVHTNDDTATAGDDYIAVVPKLEELSPSDLTAQDDGSYVYERTYQVSVLPEAGVGETFYFKIGQLYVKDHEYYATTIEGKKNGARLRIRANAAATGVPTISGTARVGEELTADLSGIADADGLTKADNGEAGFAYTYQWVRVDGVTETVITGERSSSYTLTADDEGKRVKVSVEFVDDNGFAEGPLESEAYPASEVIRMGKVIVSPTALTIVEGSSEAYTVVLDSQPSATVTVTVGIDGEADFSVSATRLTFLVSTWAAAQTVTVQAEEDDDGIDDRAAVTHRAAGGGFDGEADSVVVTVTDNDNAAAMGQPAITGIAQVSRKLTARRGTVVDANGTSKANRGTTGYAYTYQWVRIDGLTESAISGATASTYTLQPADEGKTVKVMVSFTDDRDFAEGPLTSAEYPSSGTVVAGCPGGDLWCAGMLIGAARGSTSPEGYCIGFCLGQQDDRYGKLSDRTFRYAGSNSPRHEILSIRHATGDTMNGMGIDGSELILTVEPTLSGGWAEDSHDLQLQVGDTTFNFSEADIA